MDTNGKISVIVPIYNVEPYLRQCLDSIVSQTYRNLEIILIDDGSPDNCGAICDEYAANDPRVTVIHKQNGGLSAARNDGIAQAAGDWIAFVDSDDWCEHDYYEQMLRSAQQNDADLIFAYGYYVDYPDRVKKVRTFPKCFAAKDEESLELLTVKTLLPGKSCGVAFGYPWDKLYRKESIIKNQILFDESQKAWEDCWFNFRYFDRASKIVCVPAVGYHYRQTVSSITRGYNSKALVTMCNVISVIEAYAKQNGLYGHKLEAVKEVPIPAMINILKSYFSPANRASYSDIAKSVKAMKKLPYFHEAIWSKENEFLSMQQIFLKYALRLPWVWPIRLLYWAKRVLSNHWSSGYSKNTHI